ncbi:MAG: tail fiber domain-containing protein [Bacteroidia bacterium]|nr:tail fiber domain-containing protein [Bacteroidia bacterium]MDW8235652.1 tail fiber domain-containing protein [Bacteroidia bacterium]
MRNLRVIFASLSLLTLQAQENVGIGTATPTINLHIQVPYSVAVGLPGYAGIATTSHMPSDNTQADVAFHLVNLSSLNNPSITFSKWSLWMADPDGGYGVWPNGWEIWEYPPNSGNSCCRPRFRVQAGSIAGGPAYIASDQELWAYGFITYSDVRAKQGVRPLTQGIGIVEALHPVRYRWKDTGAERIGFIAQEVQAVFPEAVRTTVDSLHGIDYMALTAVLVQAVQELSEKVAQLEQRKQALEAVYRQRRESGSAPKQREK